MSKKCGIYWIKNILNGKVYIGSSVNLAMRRRQHYSALRHNKHGNPNLQEDFDKFGENNFRFRTLEIVYDEDELIDREQAWIDCYQPEYNVNTVAGPYVGDYVRTEKANKSRSETVKELWKDPEYHAKHCKPRNWKNGIPNRRGVELSEETKEKIRQANLGENNPNYGKPRSQSFLDKMQKEYDGAISPDGEIFAPIVGLNTFCKEHGLDSGQMSRVLNGRAKSHKGWTKYEPSRTLSET